jgi:hypothetical protein
MMIQRDPNMSQDLLFVELWPSVHPKKKTPTLASWANDYVYFYINQSEYERMLDLIMEFWRDDMPGLLEYYGDLDTISMMDFKKEFEKMFRDKMRMLKTRMAGNLKTPRFTAEGIADELGIDMAKLVKKSAFTEVKWIREEPIDGRTIILKCQGVYPMFRADGYVKLTLNPQNMEDETNENWYHVQYNMAIKYNKDTVGVYGRWAESRWSSFYITESDLEPLKAAVEKFMRETVPTILERAKKAKEEGVSFDFKKSAVARLHKAVSYWKRRGTDWDHFYLLHLPQIVKNYEAKNGPLAPGEKAEWRAKAIEAGTPLPEGW